MSVSADGNTTASTLTVIPTAADHGLTLSCRASNQMIPHSELRDTWMLRVLYPPKVSLTLGHGLNATNIKEGADVYFECHLIANPTVSDIFFSLEMMCVLRHVLKSIKRLALLSCSKTTPILLQKINSNLDQGTRNILNYRHLKNSQAPSQQPLPLPKFLSSSQLGSTAITIASCKTKIVVTSTAKITSCLGYN